MKVFASLLALSAAALGFVAPATAAADDVAAAYADLNGDHRIDRVQVRPAPDDQNEQILIGSVGRTNYVTRIRLDTNVGVRPLRVVDLDRDGRQEVVVTEVVGANTLWYTVWRLDNGWQPLRSSAGGPALILFEGGGISALSRYGCVSANGHRELVVVGALLQDPWDAGIYAGDRVTYVVVNGVAQVTSRATVSGSRGTLEAMADPNACV